MPNDLVSRADVMAAVKKQFIKRQWRDRATGATLQLGSVLEAIAALPAAGDERWEKLEAAACEVISEADYQHGRSPHCFTEALWDAINNLRRAISQPPQEAGDEPGE